MTFPRRARMLAGAATITLAAAALADTAQAQEERVRWPVPMAFASNLTALGDTMPWVAERLQMMSDGNIDLRVMEPGKLIPPLAVFDSVSQGKVEAGYSWMGYEIGKVPASALFGAVPFGLEPWDFAAWMYYGGGQELLRELYDPHNVHPIFCGTISPEAAGWFKEPIESLEDVQGLKFRAAGLGGKIWQKVGASVTVLPGGELFQALEKGVLDGTEFSLPTVDEQLGFFKVAKYYYLPGWHQPSTSQYLYVNKDIWEETGEQTQAMIESACMAGVTHAIAKAQALQGPVIKRFRDEGVEAIQFPDEVLKALEDATEEVMQEEASNDEMFKKVYDSQQAFMDDLDVWNRLGFLPRDWGASEEEG